jgi:hypothetical protein
MLGQKKEKIEFVDSKVEREEIKSFSIKTMLDGSLFSGAIISKHLNFILFLVFLAVIYIGNRLRAEKVVRQLISAQEEVTNMRSEQITTASELMNLSKPSTLEDLVEKRGLALKQPTEPPYKIVTSD